uniref:Centrosome and spindle pole associated protein 1 n=1 Tax=Iconisemion striatum TaxID=60296 RepID=A0A1A7XNH4_9TELE
MIRIREEKEEEKLAKERARLQQQYEEEQRRRREAQENPQKKAQEATTPHKVENCTSHTFPPPMIESILGPNTLRWSAGSDSRAFSSPYLSEEKAEPTGAPDGSDSDRPLSPGQKTA